jgi:hypothetical protein
MHRYFSVTLALCLLHSQWNYFCHKYARLEMHNSVRRCTEIRTSPAIVGGSTDDGFCSNDVYQSFSKVTLCTPWPDLHRCAILDYYVICLPVVPKKLVDAAMHWLVSDKFPSRMLTELQFILTNVCFFIFYFFDLFCSSTCSMLRCNTPFCVPLCLFEQPNCCL